MNIKKVLLIFPPVRCEPRLRDKLVTPPLGLAYIAASIRDRFQVSILDAALEGYYQEEWVSEKSVQFGLSYTQILERILDCQPDVIGVSCLFSSQFPAVSAICRVAKDSNHRRVIVVGGSHPTFLAHECLADRNIDFIILGEGEHSFRELLFHLEQDETGEGIDGIAYRKNGRVQVNPKTHFIENLDELPFPARDLLPMEKYFAVGIPHSITPLKLRNTTIITSRGCPQQCTFCPSTNFWGNRLRMRSVENVIKEMVVLKENWNIAELQFEDDNLTADRQRARRLFQAMIDHKLGLRWSTPNGVAVWTLDRNLLQLMKASGCYELTLGIESGSPQVLKNIIHKPVDIEKTKVLIRMMKDLQIRTCGFFIVGFPGETKAQVRETLKTIGELRLDKYNVFIFNPH